MPDNFDFEAIKFTDGALTATMYDVDDDPNRVIEKEKRSYVKVEWNLVTSDPWVLNNTTFHIHVVAELIGSGEVTELATADVPVTTPSLSWVKDLDITPAVPPAPPIEDGAYKLVVLLTHTAPYPTGDKKTRLAGFYEIPMIQFYSHET
jgi:hypothetical protein